MIPDGIQGMLKFLNGNFEGDDPLFNKYVEETRTTLFDKGWYLFYDPNANDLEGEYKAVPLEQVKGIGTCIS